MTTLISGWDPTLGPSLTQSKALPLRYWGFKDTVSWPPPPTLGWDMLWCWAFCLSTSSAISAHPGGSPGPSPCRASLEVLCWWSLGARGQVSFSLCLPWSYLLSGWCFPPPPHVFGVHLSVFCCCCFILTCLDQSLTLCLPTAVNLSVIKHGCSASSLCFCHIPNKTWSPPPTKKRIDSLNSNTVSPLRTNIQVANFQRCECASTCPVT